MAKTTLHGREALKLLGFPVPATALGLIPSLLGQIGLRMLQRWLPHRFAVTDAAERDRRVWATQVLNRLTEIHIYSANALGCLDSGFRELNTVEPVGPTAELGKAYAVMAVVLGTVPPLKALARTWGTRAIAVTEAVPNAQAALSYVLCRVGVAELYDASWESAIDKLKRSATAARAAGDRRLHEEAEDVLGNVYAYAGRFAEARERYALLRPMAKISGNQQIHGWGHLGLSLIDLQQGLTESARDEMLAIEAWLGNGASASEILQARGQLALAYLRLGDLQRASEVADLVLGNLEKPAVAYWAQPPLMALSQVYLALWAHAPADPARQAEAQRKAKIACTAFANFGKIFPFGQPGALVWGGKFAAQSGKVDQARKLWTRAIDLADQLQMPMEAAQARREYGLSLAATDPERAVLLAEAVSRFEALGARWDRDQAAAA